MLNKNGQRRSWPVLVLAMGCLSLCALVAYWFGLFLQGGFISQAGLFIEPNALDFGEVWEVKAFQFILPIQNATNEDVNILAFRTSCGCMVLDPKSLILPPRAKREVRLTIDLSSALSQKVSEISRACHFDVTPLVERRPLKQPVWTIHGIVKRALAFDRACK